jgi:hypothetical protein
MAYVVARPKGRFEIRESVHTPKGPRARSLANFSRLTDAVLVTAAQRATRPFDAASVRAAADRAATAAPPPPPSEGTGANDPGRKRFVESARRMARSLEPGPQQKRTDPGDALIDLLGFVAQIAPFRPDRPPEPLRFPPLARLRAARVGAAT